MSASTPGDSDRLHISGFHAGFIDADTPGLWDRFEVAGPHAAADASDVAALSRFPNTMEVWWFGEADDKVQGAYWYDDADDDWKSYPIPREILSASKTSGIAAVSRFDSHMEVWWISSIGSVLGAHHYDGADWETYPVVVLPNSASTTSGIAALSRIPNSMEIWWVGSDGFVRGAFFYDQPPWTSYQVRTPVKASLSSGIAAMSRFPDNMEILWVGQNGSVEGAFWYNDGQDWRPYEEQVAPDNSASQSHSIAAVSRQRTSMDVVWITPEGAVNGAYWNDGAEWQLYPQLIAEDGSASTSSGVAVISRSANSIEAWWVAPDGSVQGAYWTDGVGWRRYQNPVAGERSASPSSGISAISRTATTTEIWWVAPNGSVQLAVRNDVNRPFSFRLLRPHDLLDVRCDAVGCRIVTGAAAASTTQHKVKKGETLWGIAEQYYGDGALFPLIATANKLADPDLIRPGDVLIIPPRPAPPDPPEIYIVAADDTLWDIAKRSYGDPFKYRLIAEANHIANPSLIVPGQRLIIPRLTGSRPPQSRLVAVADKAHIVVHFGVQHVFERAYPASAGDASGVAAARAANGSRVVFELPKETEMPFTVAGVLAGLTKLGLRVPPLAVPAVTTADPRPPDARDKPTAPPKADQTAIEAPYRLIVSPNKKYGGFAHAADAEAAPDDPSRVELWHTRLGVRKFDNQGKFLGVDEDDDEHRTVRAVWARDKENPPPRGPGFTGPLTDVDRKSIVRQTADPTETVKDHDDQLIEPEPLAVERLYLSSLGSWIDWKVAWNFAQYNLDPQLPTLSAYRHLATLGRDHYVRVETPVYLYPFGHRATLIKLTERKITLDGTNPAAYLYQRFFIVLRERTRDYTQILVNQSPASNNLPFKSISIDPVVSADIDSPSDPALIPFVPMVKGAPYFWKLTGIDHADRPITMITALVAVPRVQGAHLQARTTWIDEVVKKGHPIDVGDVEVAFAPEHRQGDTTSRLKYIQFNGLAAEETSTPFMVKAHINVPALAALNRGGKLAAVRYRAQYTTDGFPTGDAAQLYLVLDEEAKLDFAGGSDRGGGFVEPTISVKALSRTLGAVGDAGATADGITAGKFDPTKFLGTALPKLFGLFELKEILQDGVLAEAPKLIGEQPDFVKTAAAEYDNVTRALQKTVAILEADKNEAVAPGARRRFEQLLGQAKLAAQSLANRPVAPLIAALQLGPPEPEGPNPARDPADRIRTALKPTEDLWKSADLAAFLRALVERSYHPLESVLTTAMDNKKLAAALRSPVEGATIRYEWFPKIKGWPGNATATQIFRPRDDHGLAIAVEVRTAKDGTPQSDVTAQLRNFSLQLLPGLDQLIEMKFGRVGFRVATGGKPEVDVQFDGMEFLGILGFIEKLRSVIPFDGFADPPYVDVSAEGATAGFTLALPSVAIGVFSLENIALGADCRVPFLGEAVTVGFFFCTKEAPFRLTVLAIGGGGWVGIRLAPKGLVLLEMGLEAGASLSVDLGVASGSVSVMVGVYLRLEDKKGQLTGYFRIRGEVEVLGIASASITLELSLTYHFDSGKLIGRATLTVEIEVAFFSASVEITCERQLAGSRGDPALIDIMPPNAGGQGLWNEYYSSFAIGA